jgi:hypothetical protein
MSLEVEDMSDEEFEEWMRQNWHATPGDLLFVLAVVAVVWLAVALG